MTKTIVPEMAFLRDRIKEIQARIRDAPLDTISPVAWIGYANGSIRAETEPKLQEILERMA